MNRKPGDWNCSSCDHLNFSRRDSCQRCSDPRPGGGFGGRFEDRAEYGNFGRSGGSYGFGSGYKSGGGGSGGDYPRNYGGVGDYSGNFGGGGDNRGNYGGGGDYGRNYGGSFAGGSEVRPGDWYCPAGTCGAHNFASRSSCFKCGEAKDEVVNGGGRSYDSGRGGGYDSGHGGSRGSFGFGSSYNSAGGGAGAGWKSGDWICGRSGCNEHNFASRMECFRCHAPRESGTAV